MVDWSYSYREESDNQTDSDDFVEMDDTVEKEVNTAETIEKVLKSRFGRKGGALKYNEAI